MKAQLTLAVEEAALALSNQQGLSWIAKDAPVATVVKTVKPGDHLLCMSNGGFDGIQDKLLAALVL